MSKINLDDIAGNEFAIAYNWELLITGLPAEVKTIAANAGLTFEGQNSILNANCSVTGLPQATLTMAEATIRGHVIKQPTNQISAGELTQTFYERKDWKGQKFFEDWKELAWDKFTGRGKPKMDYMGRQGWKINSLDTEEAVQGTWELFYYVPSEVTVNDLSGEGGELVQYDVVMNYMTYKRT